MSAIRIENLTKRFGSVTALDRVSLTIAPGELFFLLGPSGCGKTTLLRTIAGFYEPDGGALFFGEKSMAGVPPHKRSCGFVFQNYALWPHMNVFENVAYGLRVRRKGKGEIADAVRKALALVRLEGLEGRRPTQLSGGQQQRVALARALVIEPEFLLLDEPLSNLDAKLRLEMRDEIRRIHGELKITTVYVTHEQKEALSLADRVAVMDRGRVEQIGDPRELYLRPANAFVAGFIGETNFFDGTRAADGAVSLPFGRLSVPGDSAAGPVTLSIRPESLRLAEGRAKGACVFPARVDRAVYYGDQTQLNIAIGGKSPAKLVTTDRAAAGAREGSEILVEIPPEAVTVFAR
jgi:iron(III) transport system ATP-binding protein